MKLFMWGGVLGIAVSAWAAPVFEEASSVVSPADLPVRDFAVSSKNDLSYSSVDRAGTVRDGEATPALDAKLVSPAFGGTLFNPGLGSIIGDDDRVQVKDTSSAPYRSIGRISIGCTGTLVGPRHVLTAGHCVYNVRSDKWYDAVKFAPGQKSRDEKPAGEVEWTKSYAPKGWTEDHNSRQDFGLIVLKEPIGRKVGYLSFAAGELSTKDSITISGYPGDKDRGTVWQSTCNIEKADDEKIWYECDTFGGQSGSAVRTGGNAKPVIRGIHAYGGSMFNSGTRINDAVFAQIKKWIAENP